MTDVSIVCAILLIALALVLFFVELILPSGMMIGLAAAAALVMGIAMLFQYDTGAGLVGAILALIALPCVLALGLKVLPHTPIFRALTLNDQQKAESALGSGNDPENPPITEGDQGQALTELRPIGTCLIRQQRVECLAARGIIASGTQVRVISVDGMQTKVEIAEA